MKQEYLRSPEIFTQNRINSQLSSTIVQPERNYKLKTVYKTREVSREELKLKNKEIDQIKLDDIDYKTENRIHQNESNLYEFIVHQKYSQLMQSQQMKSSSSSGNDEIIDDSQTGKDFQVQDNNYSDTSSNQKQSKQYSLTRKSLSNQKRKIKVKKLKLIDANSSLVIVNMNKNNLMKIEETKEQPIYKLEDKKTQKVNDKIIIQSKLQKRQELKINSKVIQLFNSDRQNSDKKWIASYNASPLNTVSHFINENNKEKEALDIGLENFKNNYSMRGKKYPENREKYIKYQMKISQQNDFQQKKKNQQSNYFQYVENPFENQFQNLQKYQNNRYQSLQFNEEKVNNGQKNQSILNLQDLNQKMANKKINDSIEYDNSISYQDNIFLQNQYNFIEPNRIIKQKSPQIDSPTPQTQLNQNDDQYQFMDINNQEDKQLIQKLINFTNSQKFKQSLKQQNQRQVVALKEKEMKKNIEIKDEKVFNSYNELNSNNATLFLKKRIDFQDIQEENIKSQLNEDNDFLDRQLSNQSDRIEQNLNKQIQQSTSDKNFSANQKETLIDQQRIFDENLSKSFKFNVPINKKSHKNNNFLPQIIPQSNLYLVKQNEASKNSIQFMTENTELSQLTFYKQMQAKRMQTISPMSNSKYLVQNNLKNTAFPQIQNVQHNKQGSAVNQPIVQMRNKNEEQVMKKSLQQNKMSPSNYIMDNDRNLSIQKLPKIKKAKLESLIGTSRPYPVQYLQQNTFIIKSFQKMNKQIMKKEQSTQSLDSRQSLQKNQKQAHISKENFIFQKEKKQRDTSPNFWENQMQQQINQQPFYQIQSKLKINDQIQINQDSGRNYMVYNKSSLNSNEILKLHETANQFTKKDTLSLIFKNNIYSVNNSSRRISLNSNQKIINSQSKISKSEQKLIKNISAQNLSFKQNMRYNNQDLQELKDNQNEFEKQLDQ